MRRSKSSEHQEQAAVIAWWRLACKGYGLPEFALFAVPNAAKRSYALASHLKAEGLRAGIPDLFLAVPKEYTSGAFLEMKAHPNKPTAAQHEVLLWLQKASYVTEVCYSAEQAITAIKTYLK